MPIDFMYFIHWYTLIHIAFLQKNDFNIGYIQYTAWVFAQLPG